MTCSKYVFTFVKNFLSDETKQLAIQLDYTCNYISKGAASTHSDEPSPLDPIVVGRIQTVQSSKLLALLSIPIKVGEREKEDKE